MLSPASDEEQIKVMDEAMILVRENNDKDDGRVWVNKYEFV